MSKPTERQKKIIEAIRQELDYWASSNDIHSPSHATSHTEMAHGFELDDVAKDGELDYVVDALHRLWEEVSGLDPDPGREQMYHEHARRMKNFKL